MPSYTNPPIPPLGFGNEQKKKLSTMEMTFNSFLQMANVELQPPNDKSSGVTRESNGYCNRAEREREREREREVSILESTSC